jgi:hypothetical protein
METARMNGSSLSIVRKDGIEMLRLVGDSGAEVCIVLTREVRGALVRLLLAGQRVEQRLTPAQEEALARRAAAVMTEQVMEQLRASGHVQARQPEPPAPALPAPAPTPKPQPINLNLAIEIAPGEKIRLRRTIERGPDGKAVALIDEPAEAQS